MRRAEQRSEGLDAGMVVFGFLAGLAVGGIYALLKAPQRGEVTRRQLAASFSVSGESLRTRLDQVVPADPVAESIAEGKAAARRRRAALGLGEPG